MLLLFDEIKTTTNKRNCFVIVETKNKFIFCHLIVDIEDFFLSRNLLLLMLSRKKGLFSQNDCLNLIPKSVATSHFKSLKNLACLSE